MASRQTMWDYAYWALTYPVPQSKPLSGYVYYSPFTRGVIPQGFHVSDSPQSLDHLQASGLVPATMQARVYLTLLYHEATDGGRAMVWNNAHYGALIDWYEHIGLWGATTFNELGKMGTILAKTRESLIEHALRDRGVPHPNALKHVRRLAGMQEISPVLLPCTQREARVPEILRRYKIQAASDREPSIRRLDSPPDWLITLLYEDGSLALGHPSSTLPTVTEVLQTLFSRICCFEACSGPDAWTQDVPYIVCEQQTCDLKALLGNAYPDFLLAFENKED